MRNLEEEIRKYKNLFNAGQIDEDTYNREVNRILCGNGKPRESHTPKIMVFFITKVVKVIIVLVVIYFGITMYQNSKVEKTIEKVDSLSNLQSPFQLDTSGREVKEIGNVNVIIDYVATYNIRGRVVDVQKYIPYNTKNRICSRDIGISWGFLAEDENAKKVKWGSIGDRRLFWTVEDEEWYEKIGKSYEITMHFSNNHLIPSNDTIKKLIKKIKEDDYIKIEGYLANISWEEKDGREFYLNTSVVRDDDGDGACEVIYVTDITWLEEY